MVAGQPEWENMQDRTVNGMPLHPTVIDMLRGYAVKYRHRLRPGRVSAYASSATTDLGPLLQPGSRPGVYPVLERADGVHVWDTDGNQYLDAVAGLGVVNIGYGRQRGRRRDRRPGGEDAVQRRQHLLERARDRAGGRHRRTDPRRPQLGPLHQRRLGGRRGRAQDGPPVPRRARPAGARQGHRALDDRTTARRWAGCPWAGPSGRRAKYLPMLLDMPHIPPIYCYRCPFGLTYPTCQVTCADELEREILRVGPGARRRRSSRSRSSRRSAARSSPSPSTSRRSARSAIATACC